MNKGLLTEDKYEKEEHKQRKQGQVTQEDYKEALSKHAGMGLAKIKNNLELNLLSDEKGDNNGLHEVSSAKGTGASFHVREA